MRKGGRSRGEQRGAGEEQRGEQGRSKVARIRLNYDRDLPLSSSPGEFLQREHFFVSCFPPLHNLVQHRAVEADF